MDQGAKIIGDDTTGYTGEEWEQLQKGLEDVQNGVIRRIARLKAAEA